METILTFLNSGPVSIIVTVSTLILMHKAGVLEVLLSFVSKKKGSLEEKVDMLNTHYNHDTTELLTEIRDEIRELNRRHENYEIVGIKTRACARHT